MREIDTPHTPQPHVGLLGRVPYTMLITNAGGGYSRYGRLAVTRWRADATRDDTGQWCYVKDVAHGRRLVGGAPAGVRAGRTGTACCFATDRVTFVRADGDIETRTEIAVVPRGRAEVRRVTLTNRGRERARDRAHQLRRGRARPAEADRAHPAFANLFVETEWHEWCAAIAATRRPRSPTSGRSGACTSSPAGDERVGPVTCETDRARFVGRGRTRANPRARRGRRARRAPSARCSIRSSRCACACGLSRGSRRASPSRRSSPNARARRSRWPIAITTRARAQRALDLAWSADADGAARSGRRAGDAALYQELAGALIYPHAALRAPQPERAQQSRAQPLLWAQGISGDWPIVLATIESRRRDCRACGSCSPRTTTGGARA